ncbi:MAG: hypothetical protein ABSG15_08005 [FCB group bacterium]
MKKNILFILCIISIYAPFILKCETLQNHSTKSLPLMLQPRLNKLLIAKINLGRGIDTNLTESKIEAALTLASEVSGKYSLISTFIMDSVANKMKAENIIPSALAVAEKLNADQILFININRKENMLRVDISSVETDNINRKSTGTGYALLHYFGEKTGDPLYDPTILLAVQRALADLAKDSLMFANAPGGFRVFPAPTLVIGGIDFQDSSKLIEWELYSKRVVISYDLVESIFEAIRDNPHYAVYDTPTRDSVYALFNFAYVENYRPPSIDELKVLDKFEVKMYISGIFRRVNKGAELELYLSIIDKDHLNIINTVKGMLLHDNIDELRILAKDLAKRLLE